MSFSFPRGVFFVRCLFRGYMKFTSHATPAFSSSLPHPVLPFLICYVGWPSLFLSFLFSPPRFPRASVLLPSGRSLCITLGLRKWALFFLVHLPLSIFLSVDFHVSLLLFSKASFHLSLSFSRLCFCIFLLLSHLPSENGDYYPVGELVISLSFFSPLRVFFVFVPPCLQLKILPSSPCPGLLSSFFLTPI